MTGTLYLVATPIGNLGDITKRALDTLGMVDFVAAEDTRVALRLLSHFGIQKPVVSYYEQKRREQGERIVERLLAGESCALTSDAGMPVLSDPGSMLVRQCRAAGVPVTAAPGACAAVTAYALSGLEGGRFTFEGFLSMNHKNRTAHLKELAGERRPMIFYEAPHKLLSTLTDFVKAFGGDRELFIARELTKLYEESYRTTLAEAVERYRAEPPRGEFVLVVDGASEAAAGDGGEAAFEAAVARARAYAAEGLSTKDAARRASEETGAPKSAVYQAMIKE